MKKSKIIQIAGRRFCFRPLPSLFFIVLLPIFLGLANWQFGREEQKRQLLQTEQDAQKQRVNLPELTNVSVDAVRYKQINLIGHYDSAHQFLLDNQINAGKAGFFVLTPFWVAGSARAVLVNRGWVPVNLKNRALPPDLSVADQELTLSGRINKFPSVGLKLKGAEIPTENWPSIIQIIDTDAVSKKLASPIWPFQVELDPNQPYGFSRDWRLARVMSPEQHRIYAMQWLALALTITVLFIGYSLKTNDE